MAALMLQVIPSFYANFSKNNLIFSANTYEKHIVFEGYCIAHHDDKLCILLTCTYDNILIGDID